MSTYNIADLLGIVAEQCPQRTALVCDSTRRSYRELLERSERLARWLKARGIGKGDTVGIHAHNAVEYIEACLGAFMVRAVPVNVNFRYTVEETRYIYADAELKCLIYGGELEAIVAPSVSAAPQLRTLVRVGAGRGLLAEAIGFEAAIEAAGPALADIGRSGEDIWLLYTGGTTGRPKGVMWTHEAVFFNGYLGGGAFSAKGPIHSPEELADRVRENPFLAHLPCGPLMHGAGMWATTIGLLAGHTVHLNGRADFNAEYILDTVAREKVGCVTIVGDAMAVPLVDALRANPGRWDLSSLVAFSSAGALFSDHVRSALQEFFPARIAFSNGIGSSEAGQVGQGGSKPGAGLLRIPGGPGVGVFIEEQERFAAPGETGTLIRFGHLPLGYYKDPVKTAATFREFAGRRFVLSGDVARLEQDGSITIFGRGSQCINTGGEKVFTEEVEEVVRGCDGIFDAQVVGVRDARWGQKVIALLSLRPGAHFDEAKLRTQCRQRLAGYKVPKHFVVVDALPRNPVGKADYRWALATAEAALAPRAPA